MPKRTLPGLGLEAYFDLGENGWNDEFDENFRRLSFLVDGRVKSRTTNLPGTGTDGDVYIVPVGQTNANQVAIWDGPTGSKAWVYYPASEGWAFYVLDEDTNYQFNGTAWVEFAAAGGGGGGGTPAPAEPVPSVYLEVVKNATQTISATTATVVFESVVEDADTLWDASTNSILIPAALNGKVVLINTQTQTTSDLTGEYESSLEKSTDGGTTWVRLGQSAHGGIHFFGISSVTILDRVSTGDRFRLRVFSAGNSTLRADDRNRITLATLESSTVSGGGGSAEPVPFSGFRAIKNATQSLAASAFERITFQVEEFDTDAGFDNSRYTVPAELNGKYAVFTGAASASGNVTAAATYIRRSTDGGSTWVTVSKQDFNGLASSVNTTGPVLLETGDMWEIWVFVSGASTLSVNLLNFFSMVVVDPGVASGGGGGGGAATFLELTDTPTNYTGQAGKAVLVNPAADGLIFGDVAAPGGSGSSENWAVPWRGATVTMAAQTLDLNSGVILSWDTQVADTDNFWDGAAPTVFTIPAGVTKVRCFMTLFLDSGAISSSTAYAVFRKNGSSLFVGNGVMGVEPGYNDQIQSLVSGVIDVVEGDTISVLAQFSDATIPVLAQTFFQIEVVEATDRSALSKLHPFFIPGLPAAGATVYQTVFTETTILKTTTPTELYAGVAATTSSVFTITRNGVSVGTITVAAAAQTGTVSVGADVTFNAGDRLSVIAPGTQDATLADVAITLALQLTS